MRIDNETNEIKYFNTSTSKFESESEIFDIIKNVDIDFFQNSIKSHEQNSSLYTFTPENYEPIIKNIIPIPPKSSWTICKNKTVRNESTNIFYKKKSNDNLLTSIKRQLKKIEGKKIGVQLSGGLDSSLIIGVLRHLDIEPVLVGMYNDRYEFRTERVIQNILHNGSNTNILIRDDDYLPFSELCNIPKHIFPNSSSLFFSSENKMAQIFEENKVDIVFNGMGLDTIFCLSPYDMNYKSQWYPYMFDNGWFHDYVYKPKSINFTSAVNNYSIVNIIWNLRHEEKEDNEKIWARNYFSDFLPPELVKFRYKSDHAGLLIDGISRNYECIKNLFEFAYNKTKYKGFSYKEFLVLFNNYHLNDDTKIKLILARTSYAVWLYSCFNSL